MRQICYIFILYLAKGKRQLLVLTCHICAYDPKVGVICMHTDVEPDLFVDWQHEVCSDGLHGIAGAPRLFIHELVQICQSSQFFHSTLNKRGLSCAVSCC
jgi:hypothetical protein